MGHEGAPTLRCDGLVKRFRKRTALDRLDLCIRAGRVTVLLGPNGAGKSTLLRCALGVLRPDGGRLRVLGQDPVRRPRPVRERLGYVPDVPDAEPWMTVQDLLRVLRPHYPTWDAAEARRLLELFELPEGVRLGALSRGQGMKAMLAAALAPAPSLLLLDEPFAGLDPLAREEVLRAVIGEIRDGARTVICATHDLDVAARIADDIAILRAGRCVRHGRLEDVLEDTAEAAAGRARLAAAFAAAATAPERVA